MKGRRFVAIIVAAGMVVAFAAFFISATRDPGDPPRATPSPEGSPTSGESPTGPTAPSPDETSEPKTDAPDYGTWSGPDQAVSTRYSSTCSREVLRFGEQEYAPGREVGSIPEGVGYLGYNLGGRQLWGDLGAPNVMYTTSNQGRTFQEWLATDQSC